MDITVNGEGENKTYTFAINTATIDGDMDADTSKWTFTLGDEVRSYDEYYGRNLQDYAYDKTGITESMFPPFIDYFGKSYLYDMVNHEGGLEGYIREKMELGEDQTLATGPCPPWCPSWASFPTSRRSSPSPSWAHSR